MIFVSQLTLSSGLRLENTQVYCKFPRLWPSNTFREDCFGHKVSLFQPIKNERDENFRFSKISVVFIHFRVSSSFQIRNHIDRFDRKPKSFNVIIEKELNFSSCYFKRKWIDSYGGMMFNYQTISYCERQEFVSFFFQLVNKANSRTVQESYCIERALERSRKWDRKRR